MSSDYTDADGDQLTEEDTLVDRGVDDLLDEGYSPPDRWKEPRDNETLDELLSEEEPDPAMQLDDPDEQAGDDEVGDRRSGRLVAPDEGFGDRHRVRSDWSARSESTGAPRPQRRRRSTSSTRRRPGRREDDGLVAVADDAVLAVPEDRPRQHGALDVGAEADEVGDAVAVIDAHDVLFDDRPLVEVLGDVVSGRADEFDAALLGPPIRRRADEGRAGTNGGC